MHQGEAFQEELLNRLAAIRAAAEILDDHEDMSSSDRRQFLLVLKTETRRLQQMIAG